MLFEDNIFEDTQIPLIFEENEIIDTTGNGV
jgi:hypothetical protein